MKERVCCVYDTDERYAVKLTEAMNKESTKKFECLMKCLEKSNVCTAKTSC